MVRTDKKLYSLSIYDGKQFKFYHDERPWTIYTSKEIEESKERYKKVSNGSKLPHSKKKY